tara:strand:+ start:127 stop:429 length:303 start_codon:yes stop_codon:yes gene_type:complete
MKKTFVIIIIFFLILFTSLVKNTTKQIEENIFSVRENIRILSSEYKNILLENNYLSSSEQLLKFQELYFENSLTIMNIEQIKILKFLKNNNLTIENMKIK